MVCFACGQDALIEYDGARTVCTGCGTVLEENAIVSEITFGETSGGAAIVTGSYVGADQARARAPAGYRQAGGKQESREQTMLNGRRRIQALANALHIPERLADAGQRYFNLAVNMNFVQGRRTQYVVAACLYCACRMDKTSHMLIDFSDMLEINVFVLGSTYLKLVKELQLQLPTVDPSLYISRFAALLEFGEETQKVAQDAVRLVARMGRDWMHIGRRPAGVCGACLLLAARMNNFRRSIAEVVQVVKIADTTLKKRLDEFRDTPSGALTVADFRTLWLDETADPPAFLVSLKKEKEQRESERKKREEDRLGEGERRRFDEGEGREALEELAAAAAEREDEEQARRKAQQVDGSGLEQPDPDEEPQEPSLIPESERQRQESMPPPPSRKSLGKRRREEDGSASVDMEKEEGEDDDDEERAEKERSPNPMEDESALDEAITSELTTTLGSRTGVALTDELDKAEAKRIELASSMTNLNTSERLDDLDEDELDAFILTNEEVEAKSRLWMQMNKEYLQALADKQTGPDGEIKPAAAKRVRKRHKPRDSQNATGANAAEATKQLLAKKRFSKKINYAVVETLFSGNNDDDEASSVGGGDEEQDENGEPSLFQPYGRSKSRSVTPRFTPRKGAPLNVPTPTFSRAGSRLGTPSRAGSELPEPVMSKNRETADQNKDAAEDEMEDWRKHFGQQAEEDDYADEWA